MTQPHASFLTYDIYILVVVMVEVRLLAAETRNDRLQMRASHAPYHSGTEHTRCLLEKTGQERRKNTF